MPHMPLFRSKDFENRSRRGRYGDVIEEIDANVGRIVDALRDFGIEQHTLVLYTSDNGPWAPYLEQAGSAGLLRGAKSTTWEGGMRVPAIFWWPGRIKSGTVSGIGSELDLLQTFAALAGAEAPRDRVLDGCDLSQTLLGGAASRATACSITAAPGWPPCVTGRTRRTSSSLLRGTSLAHRGPAREPRSCTTLIRIRRRSSTWPRGTPRSSASCAAWPTITRRQSLR